VQIKIILRTRQANPIPVVPSLPRSPAYGTPTYSPGMPYSGPVPAGMPYADPSTYPHFPPPDLGLGQMPVQPPPPNYPNPNYLPPRASVSPGHGAQQPLLQGAYQAQPGAYQQGYEGVVDQQQYPGGYDMGQPQYPGNSHTGSLLAMLSATHHLATLCCRFHTARLGNSLST